MTNNLFIGDDGAMEERCEHGVGHPVPHEHTDESCCVHTCDGCCWEVAFDDDSDVRR